MKCTIYEFGGVAGSQSSTKWLRDNMRLRLVFDKDAYEGFPIGVSRVEYDSDKTCIIEAMVSTDTNYQHNEKIKKNNTLYLAVAKSIVGSCKIVSIENIE